MALLSISFLIRILLVFSSKLFSTWRDIVTNGPTHLTANCFSQDSSEFLAKLSSYHGLKELRLEGFVFDQVNTVKFSKVISEFHIQKLSLVQCDITDELSTYLTIPSSVKSIRLERLNLSTKGIQIIIAKLSPALKSLEIMHCFGHRDSSKQTGFLDLARFTVLRSIWFESLNEIESKISESLSTLLSTSLESIKLLNIPLSPSCLVQLLEKKTECGSNTFHNTLKSFIFESNNINERMNIRLIHLVLSYPFLEVFSMQCAWSFGDISIPTLPNTLQQFSLKGFDKIIYEITGESIYNFDLLSQYNLTHLTANSRSGIFPFDLFQLKDLEYLELQNVAVDGITEFNIKPCKKLKYLSSYCNNLLSLFYSFCYLFPVIETLQLYEIASSKLNPHLKEIISCKTLKSLHLYYSYASLTDLNFDEKIESSIEELELKRVNWDFICYLLKNVHFANLKILSLTFRDNSLNLNDMLDKLKILSQLTSLTLSGTFYFLTKKKFTFSFENMRFFKLESSSGDLDLSNLLSCMPKLIEFELDCYLGCKIDITHQINIRFLTLPIRLLIFNELNLIKYIPNLIQFKSITDKNFILKHEIPASDLAYYLRILRNYFNTDMKFNINPKCLPILLLKEDTKLVQLVQLKSPDLIPFISDKFPLTDFSELVEQLFTTNVEDIFDTESVDFFLLLKFSLLIDQLGLYNIEDISFLKKIVLASENKAFTLVLFSNSNEPSFDDFTHLIANNFKINSKFTLENIHLTFIENFFKMNKHKKLLKVNAFLEYFFNLVAKKDQLIIDSDLFEVFSQNILDNSFNLLIDQIRDEQLSKQEERVLNSLISNCNFIFVKLRNLNFEQYRQIIGHTGSYFNRPDDEFNGIENFLSFLKIFSTDSEEEERCPICLDSLLKGTLKLFVSRNEKICHLFHQECLDTWLHEHDTCPLCRSVGE